MQKTKLSNRTPQAKEPDGAGQGESSVSARVFYYSQLFHGLATRFLEPNRGQGMKKSLPANLLIYQISNNLYISALWLDLITVTKNTSGLINKPIYISNLVSNPQVNLRVIRLSINFVYK